MYIRAQVKMDSLRSNVKSVGRDVFVVSLRPINDPNLLNIMVGKALAKHLHIPERAIKLWGGRNEMIKRFVVSDEALTNANPLKKDANTDQPKRDQPPTRASYHLVP
jgi:hypothetical protein